MLGSDPIYQYDTGLGHTVQGVITLEPVYPDAGGDARWVRRFLKGVVEDPCIGFNYTQAGQENSFTWDGMGRGLEMQFPILDSLRAGGAVRIETLKESASWFKKRYKVTPPTSFSALTDTYGNGNATLWFNSRYYRANILWNKDGIRFRDIHLFDERIKSDYLEERGTSNQCIYTTCPIVDGFLWSTRESYAAARFFHSTEGAEKEIIPEDVEVTSSGARGIRLAFRSSEGEKFAIVLDEKGISIEGPATGWYMKICLPDTGKVSLSATGGKTLGGEMKGIRYGVRCIKGDLASAQGEFVFSPEKGEISIDCSDRTSI